LKKGAVFFGERIAFTLRKTKQCLQAIVSLDYTHWIASAQFRQVFTACVRSVWKSNRKNCACDFVWLNSSIESI